VYVWKGGATLTGAVGPFATLKSGGPGLSNAGNGQGIQLADLTGDGIVDLVVGAFQDGAAAMGAIYVWKGGPTLVGAAVLQAKLSVPGAIGGDELGLITGQGILLGDVTGDGMIDVVAGAEFADVGGVFNSGAVYVWNGGATLVGAKAPDATLFVPGAVTSDRLCANAGQGLLLGDVTGDGILDVIVGSSFVDLSSVVDVGAIYVWNGGAGLSGSKGPDAALTVPAAVASDQLGSAAGQAILLGDVTGDGILDVVGAANPADVGGVSNTGAFYLWKGGAPLAGARGPDVTLAVPGAITGDGLGN
jgi:hypothetical protein